MANKLDLVNHLLQTVGEGRVLSLETGHPSVIQALQALNGYDEDFQGLGWWFNKNQMLTLTPNNLGEILLPDECLKFSITHRQLQWLQPNEKARYVTRGKRVYDSWLNTYNIGFDLVADLVVRIPVEDLPPTAASYLKHMAAEAYYTDDDGDNQKADRLAQRAARAFHALKAEEMEVLAVNALNSPSAQSLTHRVGQASGTYPMVPGGRIIS